MEERKMKIDPTKTLVHVLYTYNGTQDGMYCFTLMDDWALVLGLPWTDYTVEFPIDPLRPLQVGDTVSVVYAKTHQATPRLSRKPTGWYVMPKP